MISLQTTLILVFSSLLLLAITVAVIFKKRNSIFTDNKESKNEPDEQAANLQKIISNQSNNISKLEKDIGECRKTLKIKETSEAIYNEKLDELKKISINAFNISEITSGDIFKNLTKQFQEFFNAYNVNYWEAKNKGEDLKLMAQSGFSEQGIKKFEKYLPTSDKLLKAAEEKNVIIDDISSFENSLQIFLKEEGVVSVVELPFFKGEELCGIFEFFLKDKERMEINKRLFQQISTLMSLACEIYSMKFSSNEELQKLKQQKDETVTRLNQQLENYKRDLEELKQFERLTIGRELEMLNLKKQISQLNETLAKHGIKSPPPPR